MTQPVFVRAYPASGTLGAANNTLSVNIDTTGLTDGAIVVFPIAGREGGDTTGITWSATLGGSSTGWQTVIGTVINAASVTGCMAGLGLLNPASSASIALSITWSGGTGGFQNHIAFVIGVYSNVSGFTAKTPDNDGSTSTTDSMTNAAAANNKTVGAWSHGSAIASITTGTLRGVINNDSTAYANGCIAFIEGDTIAFSSGSSDSNIGMQIELLGTGGGLTVADATSPVTMDNVTLVTAPGAPTISFAQVANKAGYLGWSLGASNGGTLTSTDIDWSADGGTNWLGPVSIPASLTRYKLLGLTNATSYIFRVRHVNSAGVGPWSSNSSSWTPNDKPTILFGQNAAITASRSPALTFGQPLLTGDVVIMWPGSTGTSITPTAPTGWVNVLGGTTDVESDSHELACIYHIVTAAEESAGTLTFTATNLFGATTTGNVVGAAVRNVNNTSVLGGTGTTFSSTNTATPHVLAGVTPTVTDGLVLSCVAADGTDTYASAPTGWTFVANAVSNTNQGKTLCRLTAFTTNGNAVAAANITPSGGDEYASITVVLAKAPDVTPLVPAAMTLPTNSDNVVLTPHAGVPQVVGNAATSPVTMDNVVLTQHNHLTVADMTLPVTMDNVVFGQVFYPASISNRKWLDQNGDVFLLKTCSSWSLAENLTNAEMDTYLTAVKNLGFNCVTVSLPGHRGPNGTGWGGTSSANYGRQNEAGQPFWASTASTDEWNTSLGTGWASYDHLMQKATELGLNVILSLYTGAGDATSGPPPAGMEGVGPVLEYQYNRLGSSTYLATIRTIGQAVATRYSSYHNIIWHLGADKAWSYAGAPALALSIDSFFQGIRDIEGATQRMRIAEPANESLIGHSAYTQWGTDFTYFTPLSADSVYHYENTAVEIFDDIYVNAAPSTYPVWDCEPGYVENANVYGAGGTRTTRAQQIRERVYSTLFRNGIGINWGHESIYGFDQTSWWGSEPWTTALTDAETLQAGYAWSLLDVVCKDTTWGRDGGTFLTTGVGSGDTKAASGFSNTRAAAYFPNSRTIAVDTTVISGTGNVRLRWFDPTNGTYTTIAASEAQQAGRSVTHPGNHADGTADWVLVVDSVAVAQLTTAYWGAKMR